MKIQALAMVITCGILSAGCATTNFAPPAVNLETNLTSGGAAGASQLAASGECTLPLGSTDITRPNVANARSLIQNFVLVYRCRAHAVANGRQTLQVPAFLSTLGATAASAFGAGPDVAIAGGIGSSVFNAGNSYYDPKRQAEIFDGALDALLCIKTESVGIDPLDIGRLDAAGPIEDGDESGGGVTESAVYVTPSEQYFDLVQASLFSVERVVAQRLNTLGTNFDPAGVIAEITTLTDQIRGNLEDKVDESEVSDGDPEAGGSESEGGADLRNVRIDLKNLQPKLQRCVVRAKI